MEKNDRFAGRVFALAVIAVLAYLLLRILRPFFGPIFWASLLALMLFQLNLRLRRALSGRRAVAAALLTVAVTLGIVIPVALVGVAFAREGVDLARGLSATIERNKIEGLEDLVRLPVVGGGIEWLRTHFGLDPGQIRVWIERGTEKAVQFLLAHGRGVLFGAFGLVGDLTVMLFILFFFFRDGDTIAQRAIRLVPLDEERKLRLVAHLKGVTEAVVLGTIITAVAQGALIGIAFWITGLSSPVVFGVLAGIASFIPFVGTSLVVLPATVYLALSQGIWWQAVFMLAWGVLVAGSADNFLKPLLISGRAEIGTLPVFLGVLGGLAAFGMAGLFVGPVILALALVLMGFAEEASQQSAGRAASP